MRSVMPGDRARPEKAPGEREPEPRDKHFQEQLGPRWAVALSPPSRVLSPREGLASARGWSCSAPALGPATPPTPGPWGRGGSTLLWPQVLSGSPGP